MAMNVYVCVFLSLATYGNSANLPAPPGFDPIQHLTNLINEMNQTFTAKIDALKHENTALKQNLSSSSSSSGSGSVVGFTARLSHPMKLGEHQPVEYDQVITNEGNGYDNRDGHFSAPVAGTYVFAFTIMGIPNERLHLDIVKNGNTLLRAFSGSGDYTMGTQVVITNLVVGDRVWVRHSEETGALTVNDDLYNTFSGFLLR